MTAFLTADNSMFLLWLPGMFDRQSYTAVLNAVGLSTGNMGNMLYRPTSTGTVKAYPIRDCGHVFARCHKSHCCLKASASDK